MFIYYMVDYQLIEIKKSNKPEKKYVAVFLNKKTGRNKRTHFGATGYEDYTQHHDKIRREKYQYRHEKDLESNDPTKAGFLSYYVLWGESTSINENIKAYKNKFGL